MLFQGMKFIRLLVGAAVAHRSVKKKKKKEEKRGRLHSSDFEKNRIRHEKQAYESK